MMVDSLIVDRRMVFGGWLALGLKPPPYLPLLLVLVLLLSGFHPLFSQRPESARENFQAGAQYLLEGRTQDARTSLLKAVELNEPVPELYALVGEVLERTNEIDLALELLRKGAERFPDFSEIFSELGHFYLLKGSFQEGIGAYERAVEISGRNKEDALNLAAAYYRMGLAQFKNRNYFDSLVAAKKAIRLAPETADFHHLLGVSYFALEQNVNAREAFQKAIELNPGKAAYHYDLAVAHLRLNSPEKAEESFKKALNLDPDFAMAYLFLGRIYHNQKKTEEALQAFEKAREKDPTLKGLHYHIGFAHKALGQDDLAIKEMEKEIELYPDYLPARIELGDLYLRKGYGEAANRHLVRAVELDPRDPRIRFLLGKALFELGQFRDALNAFSEASRLNPALPDAYYWRAQIYMKQGRQDLARKEIELFQQTKKGP